MSELKRPTWKTDGGWQCLNCRKSLAIHVDQLYCPSPAGQDSHPIDREGVIELLRESLRLEVQSSQEYTGGMGDGPLYTTIKTVQLVLDGEVISEVSL